MTYYMSRYSSPAWYTFEFIVIMSLFFILIWLWRKKNDKSSLKVYLVTGIAHSIVELVGQGLGIREISNMFLFDVLHVEYPFTALIMGFFEGGMFCLVAYHILRLFMSKDRFSLKFILISSTLLVVATTILLVTMDYSTITFSRREIFAPISIILLVSFYGITIGYFFLTKRVTRFHLKALFSFIVGMMFITLLFTLPPHIAGIRFIEVWNGSNFVYASLPEQILLMYAYGIPVGAAGYFLLYYIILIHFKWIDFGQGNSKNID